MEWRFFMRYKLFIVFICCAFWAGAQTFSGPGWGVQVGAHISLGTHRNRIGFTTQAFYGYRFFQINAALSGFFALENWASPHPQWELQTKIGGVVFSGYPKYEHNPFLSVTNQQFGKPLALSYAYQYYFNSRHTSHESGIFGIEVYRFHLDVENDLFGGLGSDRYRTAAVRFSYQYHNYCYAINTIMYTGSYNPNDGIMYPRGYPSRFGVRKMTTAHLPNASVGIMAAEVQTVLPYGQIIGGQLGVDAEQIRNFFQNKLIHNRGFLPNKFARNGNPHIPMRTVRGNSYLYLYNQKVQKPKPFVQFDVNPIGMY